MKASEIINAINNVEWDCDGNPLYSYSQLEDAMKKIAEISLDKCEEIDYENTSAIESNPTIVLSEWVLLVDIDFFGRLIDAGTIFRQVNADYYHPIINGARCPSYQIHFMIVKNNPKVFLKRL